MIPLDLTGKTALVTGGGHGVGAGVAKRLSAAGATVFLSYCGQKAEAEATAAMLGAHALFLDQAAPEAAEAALRALSTAHGLDILINNAGIYPSCTAAEMTVEKWEQMQEINVRGVFFLSRAAAAVMPSGGTIVNISSINAVNPAAHMPHYCISKAAVECMTKNLAVAFGPLVRVNAVAPGLVDSEKLDRNVPGWRERYVARAPLQSLVTPEDIGDACLFLCSDMAKHITGQVLTVDAGVLLAPAF